MPLHTGFHPTCAVAFCPIYDTARQNFASKVRRSSWENHLFRFTYCAMERRLKNCGSHCWHSFRSQRLIGMVCRVELERSILQSWQIYFTGCDCCLSTKFFAKQVTAKTALFVPVWFSSTDIKSAKRLCWFSWSTTVFWNKNYFSL